MVRTWCRTILVAGGLAVGASGAQAQYADTESGGVRFLIGGGTTLALGDFGDAFNNGPHGVAGVAFQPAGFPVGIRIDGMYHRISGDEDALGFDDVNTQVINGTANAVLSLSTSTETPIRPYILAGGGLYNLKAVGDDVPDGTDGDTEFGINAGAGFDYRASDNLGIFLEGRFHLIFADPDNLNMLPISLGVRIGH
ncbi:MAG TPA: outer membrane beta-barrel protein [Gemmatimonadales bacterium]|nr:outer membrane beta-barrel protein [Gemmatimonadales bacterium]